MITTNISSKYQITLPVSILHALSLKKGDIVTISANDKEINIKPVGDSLIDNIAGSINIASDKRGVPYSQALKDTKKLVAAKLAKS